MRTLFIASLALGFALAASRSSADPMLRYTWGPADGLVVNQDFTGPTTYTQTLSVTGLSGAVSHFDMTILHPYYGPGSAWHAINPPQFTTVNPPQTDCEGGPGYSISATVAGATSIPNATPSIDLTCFEGITNHTVTCYSAVRVTIDPPFVADPGTRYGLLTLEYHHQNSVVGVSPDACDGAELPMCFVQVSTAYATVNGTQVILRSEGGALSWQNGTGAVNCYRVVTPTRSSTWGSIKTFYR